jgi:tetratricopeptide (TPR) repeat protein
MRGRLEWRRDGVPLIPWFIIGATSGLFTAWVERNLIGAKGAEFELTAAQHFLLTGRILCFYVVKVLWPVNLMFSYPRWKIDPAAWWQYLYPLAVIAALFGLWVLSRRRGAPVQRGPLAGFLYFGGTLFPVLGFLHVYPFRYSYVADHFQYLAMLGIIVPMTWLLSQTIDRGPRAVVIGGALALLSALGVLTWRQASLYRDVEVLYRETLIRNPESWMTHNNLGIYLVEQKGRPNDAMAEFEAVLRIKPDHAKAHMNLGNILAQDPQRAADAIAEYHKSLQLDPTYVPTYLNLGMLLMRTPGRLPDAVAELQTAVQRAPNDATAHALLASALAQTPGRLPDAIKEYQAVLWLRPGEADTHLKLAEALAKLPERRQDAIAQYQIVLQLRPDSQPARQGLEELQKLDTQSH